MGCGATSEIKTKITKHAYKKTTQKYPDRFYCLFQKFLTVRSNKKSFEPN